MTKEEEEQKQGNKMNTEEREEYKAQDVGGAEDRRGVGRGDWRKYGEREEEERIREPEIERERERETGRS